MDIVTASPLRTEFLILFLALCGLAFLSGVLLNTYVLFITGCQMERTVSAILFLSQAMADFFFIVFLPLRLISIFIQDSEWAERLSSTIISLHLFSSAFLLMALSVHRCILVSRPAWAQNHCTPRLAVWVVLGIWVLSFGFGFRYSNLMEFLLQPARIRILFQVDKERLKAAVAIQFLVGFLIPLTFVLTPTIYILLAAKLRRNRLIQSTKPLKILLGLVPSFFICWLPYHIVCFLQISATYRLPLQILEWNMVCVPAYFSSCLNPIFYLTMEDEFLRYCQHALNPQTANNSGTELEGMELSIFTSRKMKNSVCWNP